MTEGPGDRIGPYYYSVNLGMNPIIR
jgi:hypothetical protein